MIVSGRGYHGYGQMQIRTPGAGPFCPYRGYGKPFSVMTLSGYGQEEIPNGEGPETPTREEVLAATAAAEAAAKEAELQMALARQQQGFNTQIIAGFLASAALGVVMWGIAQAVQASKGGQ